MGDLAHIRRRGHEASMDDTDGAWVQAAAATRDADGRRTWCLMLNHPDELVAARAALAAAMVLDGHDLPGLLSLAYIYIGGDDEDSRVLRSSILAALMLRDEEGVA